MKNDALDLLSYNYWANAQLHLVFCDLPSGLADKEIDSSFRSLRLTVEHYSGAEHIWLQRILRNSITGFPVFEQSDFPPLGWLDNAAFFLSHVKQMSETEIIADVYYKNLKGDEFSTPCIDIIKHVVNHSTFHRGQCITLLRLLGCKVIPSTDYIAWIRNGKKV